MYANPARIRLLATATRCGGALQPGRAALRACESHTSCGECSTAAGRRPQLMCDVRAETACLRKRGRSPLNIAIDTEVQVACVQHTAVWCGCSVTVPVTSQLRSIHVYTPVSRCESWRGGWCGDASGACGRLNMAWRDATMRRRRCGDTIWIYVVRYVPGCGELSPVTLCGYTCILQKPQLIEGTG